MAESDTILQLGIEAAREGNREEARNLFSLLTRQEPDNVQAWLWLAGVAEGPDQRRVALERVVELDPSNEMAQKGLQAMGVAPSARADERVVPPTVELPPVSSPPARDLTDEERYAAELDSAFDDYDTVPRAETPPRIEHDDDTLVGMPTSAASDRATERAAMSSRDRARERAQSRREASRARAFDDEGAVAAVNSGPNYLLLGLATLVVLGLLFLLYSFLTNRGQQVAGDTTATAVRGGVGITETVEAGPTPTLDGIGVLTPTDSLPPTGLLTPTTPLTPTDSLTPTDGLTLTPAPVGPPPDLAGANPAPVEIGAVLEANGWNFSFPNLCPLGCAAVVGPQISGFSAQPGNTFVIVLVAVANNTGTPQPLPPDFFVIKDAQGNIYQPQPQVSSAYVIRGVNADVGMEDQVPANGGTTSMPLVFEVKSGATNLVLFARSKTDQGWPLLAAVP
jgi:hypothetical protein